MSLKSTFKDHQSLFERYCRWIGMDFFLYSSDTATSRRWMQSIHDYLIWCKFGLVHVTLFLLLVAFCCAAYVPYCAHKNTSYVFQSILTFRVCGSQISDFRVMSYMCKRFHVQFNWSTKWTLHKEPFSSAMWKTTQHWTQILHWAGYNFWKLNSLRNNCVRLRCCRYILCVYCEVRSDLHSIFMI